MRHDAGPSRKEFLLGMAGAALAQGKPSAPPAAGKALVVVAHPDNEYALAATLYRLVQERGWTADQVVITNGEAGYRYSTLAETYYGVPLAAEADGRARLPAIRKEEARRAGKVLGIHRHYFLDQKDLGFATDAASADSSNWDRPAILAFLADLLGRERYDAVFTLLPTEQTHGHHRAATLLALEAVARLPSSGRPLVFGADAQDKAEAPGSFSGLRGNRLSATVSPDPVLVFDRTQRFGYRSSLNYQIVVNWVIAEHKSQGLFQMDAGRHELEDFWLFQVGGPDALDRLDTLRNKLGAPTLHTSVAPSGPSTCDPAAGCQRSRE